MGQISDILEWLLGARFFTLFRMTERNCILVVYLIVFDDTTCYNAKSSKMLAPNPSGAAI